MGEALRAALERWPDEICLIEADRDRENARLTYRQFKEAALPLGARACRTPAFARHRAAIIMTNQSKWLISAYAIFFCGGVLVPLDYKLTRRRAAASCWRTRRPKFLIVEYHLWRAITQAAELSTRCRARGSGDRSARGRRSGGREALGGISRRARADVCAARAGKIRPASSIPPAPAGGRRAAC